MRRTPVILGTLSITFGSLTAAWSLFGFFVGSMFGKMTELTRSLPNHAGQADAHLEAAAEVMRAQDFYMRVNAAVFLVMSAALVVIGVGLYRRRPWARRAAIGWAVVGLLVLVAHTIVSFAYVQPHALEVQHAVYAAHGLPDPPQLPSGAQGAAVVLSQLFYVPFPIVLLALLGRRSASGDFVQA
jgi:multisubunit Na+/H+ antiporter MnhG subunit